MLQASIYVACRINEIAYTIQIYSLADINSEIAVHQMDLNASLTLMQSDALCMKDAGEPGSGAVGCGLFAKGTQRTVVKGAGCRLRIMKNGKNAKSDILH